MYQPRKKREDIKQKSCSTLELLHYKFDSFMAKRGSSIFISLVLIFLIILTFAGVLRGMVYLFFPELAIESSSDVLRNIYISFLQMADPGNMAFDLDASILIKLIGIGAGIMGMIMFSALIALITTALDQKIQTLKKGHSKVIESGHTLILGWNEQRIVEILRELIEANESETDPAVVILSEIDKEIMDDHLEMNLDDTSNTRIITRSGSVSSMVNLEIVSVATCKSVVALATCHEGADEIEKMASDAKVIKTILAVIASTDEKHNIVAEIFNPRNRSILEGIAPGEITTIDARDILSRILVQTSRSTGLAMVYSEMLSFKGCEIYFHHDEWGDVKFKHLAQRFVDGIPLGIRHEDNRIEMRPDFETELKPSDDIVVLAQDDSTIEYLRHPVFSYLDLSLKPGHRNLAVENQLIIGWTAKTETIISQYSDYVLEGSTIDILLASPTDEAREHIDELQEKLTKIKLSLIEMDPFERNNLRTLKLHKYNNIIILGKDDNEIDAEQADAETLILLLLFRKVLEEQEDLGNHTKLITEVLESRDQELVTRAGVDDYVISNQIISMIMSQISESQDIKRVYSHLFQAHGSEVYIKPASLYFDNFPIETNFMELMNLAQKRNEVCMGIKLKELEKDYHENFGITLDPPKDKFYRICADDALVVLAEDET